MVLSRYSDLQSCMICVARRITAAVERTERFSTRHELSGKFPPCCQINALSQLHLLSDTSNLTIGNYFC